MSSSTFSELRRLLETDPESAFPKLFQRYSERLILLVRSRIQARFRPGLGASDVVQEALASFFWRHRERPFDVVNEEALWGLLTQITLYKCGKMVRALSAQKRGGGQVVPLRPTDSSSADWDVMDEEPTPEEAVLLEETVSELLRGLRDVEQRICTLRLEGYGVQEIAGQVNLTEETVSRKLRKIKDRLIELVDAVA